MYRIGETMVWFRVWHMWASWAKKGVKPYLNTVYTYGYTYPVTNIQILKTGPNTYLWSIRCISVSGAY
jgi:hypothetical protein